MKESHLGEKNHFYGKTHTEETIQKNREANQGDKHPNYGKHHTEDTIKLMSEAKLGEKHPRSKTVYQYDLDDNFIRSFASTGEAARYIGKNHRSKIAGCAKARERGKHQTAHNFKWSYTEL